MPKNLCSVFCDDVRLEVGNKLSFMGTYSGSMIVPGFPFDIPRLSVFLKVGFDEEEPSSGPFRLVILLNDHEIASVEVPDEAGQGTSPDLPKIEGATDLRLRRSAQMLFTLPPLRIEAPSILRSRAIFENETLRGDGLFIVTQQN